VWRERKSLSISTTTIFFFIWPSQSSRWPKSKRKIIPHTQTALVTWTQLKASIALSTHTWPAGHFPFLLLR
jgi:hypothetical protein